MPEYDSPPVPPLAADTFNEIDLIGATAGTVVFTAKVTADAQTRFSMTASGTMSWGPGNAAKDIVLTRTASSTMVLGPSSTEGLQVSVVGSVIGITELGNVPGRTIQFGTLNDRNVEIQTQGGTTWLFGSTLGGGANFYPSADNTGDVGGSALRVRSIYWGTKLLGPNGSAGAPSYSFASSTTTGFWRRGADLLTLSIAGADNFEWQAATFALGSTSTMCWGNASTISAVSAFDVCLYRDAAAVLALKNLANAQTFRVYGTTTGPKYLAVLHDSTNGYIQTNSGALVLNPATNVVWTGSLLPNSDNGQDICSSGARARSIYWGTQLLGPNGSVAAPSYSFSGITTLGIYRNTNVNIATDSLGVAVAGASSVAFGASFMWCRSDGGIAWASTADLNSATTADVLLIRDAAATLGLKNGTTAQTFRVYGTTTGPKYAALKHDGTNGVYDLVGGGLLNVSFGGAAYYQFNSSATGFVPGTDNGQDNGGSGQRWRSVYWGIQGLGPDGSAGTPSHSFTTDTTSGMYRASDGVYVSFGGAGNLRVGTNVVQLAVAGVLQWGTGDPGSSADTKIVRDAANVVAMKNSTTAQEFRVYGTTTGTKYASLKHDGNNTILAQVSGTGQISFATAAQAVGATAGWLTIPSCAGTPTGVPANLLTGQVGLAYDSTNNKLYVYNGGWKRAQVTAVDAIYA